jgi:hypothetical protein
MNSEQERMCKEAANTYFEVLSQHLQDGNQQNDYRDLCHDSRSPAWDLKQGPAD